LSAVFKRTLSKVILIKSSVALSEFELTISEKFHIIPVQVIVGVLLHEYEIQASGVITIEFVSIAIPVGNKSSIFRVFVVPSQIFTLIV